DAIVIGAGFGGLAAAIKLRQAGFKRLVVLEKAERLGGTWRDNTYPGAACDVPSRLYSYSFALNPNWSRAYSGQAEIQRYMEDCADRFGVRGFLRFDAEVERADWDEAGKVWRVSVKGGEVLEAPVLISALGQLNRPSFAGIPGRESFGGESWHSARWRHDVDLAGKTVACIGSGASAIQYIPEVAKVAGKVLIFQRTPNYIVPRLDKPTPEWLKRLYAAAPVADRLFRHVIWRLMDLRFRAFKRGTKAAEAFRKLALGYLEREIPDPELRAKLTPDYSIGCKRILISDDYYAALRRENVQLITEAVKAITPSGVKTADGAEHAAEVLVYGTGFDTTDFLAPLEIHGAGGRTLSEAWKDGAEAYLGVTVSGFPNLFMLYGPNTNLGHNSIIVMIEAQVDYVVKLMREMRRRGAKAVDVKPAAFTAFNARLQKDLEATAWAGECSSWYKTASGKITNNWSGDTAVYRKQTARPRVDDYAFA
ncbi:MAG TPA: NAD(P)/FAD-dependent oxidoreductase, partial [Caulobacteraceae bacterium]|nr:NAD(P)/FAD-dependent oxidoreductase [Caulobacteraceae bacterium]